MNMQNICSIKPPHTVLHIKSLKSHKKETCRWQGRFLFFCVRGIMNISLLPHGGRLYLRRTMELRRYRLSDCREGGKAGRVSEEFCYGKRRETHVSNFYCRR